ncbi:DUF6470 family protein [Alkalicoccobacillus murimartini]|uniref:Uncharacterized protein n=1 Tax=Alkalicoccobacillus murimartini TaxID=171685 RepID=A0ABT9YFX8_9BACI|nr:DUF6470 family protein [Alkalicoccobacillus murimartini]MDQ0206764.1 hypothetical protein [Alkalicoccobacillus murimartini]
MISSQLHIQSADAKLGTQSLRPPMKIDQGLAELSIVKTGTDQLSISQEAATLYIDQSKAFAEANLKKASQLSSDWAAKAKATAHEYVANKAEEGNQLAKIERGVTIPQLIKQKSSPPPPASNVQFMPRSIDRVRIHVERGGLSIQAPDAKVSVHVNSRPTNIEIPRWEVNHQLIQKPSISFSVHMTT